MGDIDQSRRPSSSQAIRTDSDSDDGDQRILEAWATEQPFPKEDVLAGSSPSNRPAAPPLALWRPPSRDRKPSKGQRDVTFNIPDRASPVMSGERLSIGNFQAISAAKKRRSSWAPAPLDYEAAMGALGAEQLTDYARKLGAGALGRRQDSSREPNRNSGEHAVDRKRSAIRFAKASMPSNPQGVATQGGIFGLGKIPQLFLSKKKDVSQIQEPSLAVSRAGIPLMTQAGPGPGPSKAGGVTWDADPPPLHEEEMRKPLIKRVEDLTSMAQAALKDPSSSNSTDVESAGATELTSEETAALVKRDFMRQSVSMMGGHGIVKSLATLAPFVPKLLKEDIIFNDARYKGFDVANIRNLANVSKTLSPSMEDVQAAIMIADVKGFTRLTEILSKKGTAGVELLTNCMNNYFTRVIDLINSYDGDVIKFAGDSMIVAFTPSRQEREQGEIDPEDVDRGLRFAAMRATKCALELSTRLGHMRMKMNGQVEPAHNDRHPAAEEGGSVDTPSESQAGSHSTQRMSPWDTNSTRMTPTSTIYSGLTVRADIDSTASANQSLGTLPSHLNSGDVGKGLTATQSSAFAHYQLDSGANQKRKGILAGISQSIGAGTSSRASSLMPQPTQPPPPTAEDSDGANHLLSTSASGRVSTKRSMRRGLNGLSPSEDVDAESSGSRASGSRASDVWDNSMVQRELSVNTRLNIPPSIRSDVNRQSIADFKSSGGGSSEQRSSVNKAMDFASLLLRIPVHHLASSPHLSPDTNPSSSKPRHSSPLGRNTPPQSSPTLSPHSSKVGDSRASVGNWESTLQVLTTAAVAVTRSQNRLSDGKRSGSSSSLETPHPTSKEEPSTSSAVHIAGPERSRLSQSSLAKELSELHASPYHPTVHAHHSASAISGASGLPPLAPPPHGTSRTNSDQSMRIPVVGIRGGSFTQQHSAMHQKLFKKKGFGSPPGSGPKQAGKLFATRGSRKLEDAVSSDEEEEEVKGGGRGGRGPASARSASIESVGEKEVQAGAPGPSVQWSDDSYAPESVQPSAGLPYSSVVRNPGPLGEGVEDDPAPSPSPRRSLLGGSRPAGSTPAGSRPAALDPSSHSPGGSPLASAQNSLPAPASEVEAQVSEGVLSNDALRRGTDSENPSPKGSFVSRKGSFVTRLSSWFNASGKGGTSNSSPRGTGSILGMLGGSPKSTKSNKSPSGLLPSSSFDDLSVREGGGVVRGGGGQRTSLLSQASHNIHHPIASGGQGGAGSSQHSRLGISSPQNPPVMMGGGGGGGSGGESSMRQGGGGGYYGGSVASVRHRDPIMEEVTNSKFSLKLIVAAGCVCAFHVGGGVDEVTPNDANAPDVPHWEFFVGDRPLAPEIDDDGRRGCFAQLEAIEEFSEAARVVISPEVQRLVHDHAVLARWILEPAVSESQESSDISFEDASAYIVLNSNNTMLDKLKRPGTTTSPPSLDRSSATISLLSGPSTSKPSVAITRSSNLSMTSTPPTGSSPTTDQFYKDSARTSAGIPPSSYSTILSQPDDRGSSQEASTSQIALEAPSLGQRLGESPHSRSSPLSPQGSMKPEKGPATAPALPAPPAPPAPSDTQASSKASVDKRPLSDPKDPKDPKDQESEDLGVLQSAPGAVRHEFMQYPQSVQRRMAGLLRMHVIGSVRGHIETGHLDFINELRPLTCIFLGFPSLLVDPCAPKPVLPRSNRTSFAGIAAERSGSSLREGMSPLPTTPEEQLAAVQFVMHEIQEVMKAHDGSFMQFRCDEKGFVGICALGLPGHTHEDNPTRGILSALDLNKRIVKGGHKVCVGVTTGQLLCTCVGARKIRSEYTVFGDAINLSARLMVKVKKGMAQHDAALLALQDSRSNPLIFPPSADELEAPPAILCDEYTCQHSRFKARFEELEPIPLKGKAVPVIVYGVSALDNDIGQRGVIDSRLGLGTNSRLQSGVVGGGDLSQEKSGRGPFEGEDRQGPERPLVGRDAEMTMILGRAADLISSSGPSGGVAVIEGNTGMGKTKLLVEVRRQLEKINEEMTESMLDAAAAEGKSHILDNSARTSAFNIFVGVADTANKSQKLYPWRQIFYEIFQSDRASAATAAAPAMRVSSSAISSGLAATRSSKSLGVIHRNSPPDLILNNSSIIRQPRTFLGDKLVTLIPDYLSWRASLAMVLKLPLHMIPFGQEPSPLPSFSQGSPNADETPSPFAADHAQSTLPQPSPNLLPRSNLSPNPNVPPAAYHRNARSVVTLPPELLSSSSSHNEDSFTPGTNLQGFGALHPPGLHGARSGSSVFPSRLKGTTSTGGTNSPINTSVNPSGTGGRGAILSIPSGASLPYMGGSVGGVDQRLGSVGTSPAPSPQSSSSRVANPSLSAVRTGGSNSTDPPVTAGSAVDRFRSRFLSPLSSSSPSATGPSAANVPVPQFQHPSLPPPLANAYIESSSPGRDSSKKGGSGFMEGLKRVGSVLGRRLNPAELGGASSSSPSAANTSVTLISQDRSLNVALNQVRADSQSLASPPVVSPSKASVSFATAQGLEEDGGLSQQRNTLPLLIDILREYTLVYGPIVILFESLHEFDTWSWQLLIKVADALGSGLLIVATTRPNHLPNNGFSSDVELSPSGGLMDALSPQPMSGGGQRSASHVLFSPMQSALHGKAGIYQRVAQMYRHLLSLETTSRILLEPFEFHQTQELMQMVGEQEYSSDYVLAIMEKTGGMPLYIEMIVDFFNQRPWAGGGGGQGGQGGQGELADIVNMMNFQQVIIERMDRLKPRVQLCLKVASVMGQLVDLDILHKFYPINRAKAEVREYLGQLERCGFLKATDTDGVWEFNMVERDIVYKVVPHYQRRKLHAQLAQELERSLEEQHVGALTTIAYHWNQACAANETSEILCALKAVEYWHRAAGIAYDNSSLMEALRLFQKASEIAEILSEAGMDAGGEFDGGTNREDANRYEMNRSASMAGMQPDGAGFGLDGPLFVMPSEEAEGEGVGVNGVKPRTSPTHPQGHLDWALVSRLSRAQWEKSMASCCLGMVLQHKYGEDYTTNIDFWGSEGYFTLLTDHAIRGLMLLGAPHPAEIMPDEEGENLLAWADARQRRRFVDPSKKRRSMGGHLLSFLSFGCIRPSTRGPEVEEEVWDDDDELLGDLPDALDRGIELLDPEVNEVRDILLVLIVAAENCSSILDLQSGQIRGEAEEEATSGSVSGGTWRSTLEEVTMQTGQGQGGGIQGGDELVRLLTFCRLICRYFRRSAVEMDPDFDPFVDIRDACASRTRTYRMLVAGLRDRIGRLPLRR